MVFRSKRSRFQAKYAILIIGLLLITGCTQKNTYLTVPTGDLSVETITLREPTFDDLRFPVEVLKIVGVSDVPTY